MATTDTDTVREICTDALREAGIVAIDEESTADEIDVALRHLNRMLKAWQNRGYNLWTVTGMSETATTSASYTLDPVRPHSIVNVRWKNTSGSEIPMTQVTRDEYDSIPNKSSAGTPVQWYFDRQREAAELYVWPVPSAVTTETLEITYNREIEDMGLNDAPDVPGEWYEAVLLNLALRLCNPFGVEPPTMLPLLAGEALKNALADDREASVYIGCAGDYD